MQQCYKCDDDIAMPQGQVIMVQMPDGRMVPAQVTGVVQPQMTLQQPLQMQIQQNVNQVPTYNPDGDQNEIMEEQNEGEGGTKSTNIPNAVEVTDGGEVYQ